MKRIALVAALGLAASCTKKVDQCSHDSDCTDPAFPFCDVDGQFAPSGGDKNVCTITPPDCPVDVCGCTPGATTCATGQLATCNSDGMSATMTACSISCAADGVTCATFTPTNGLGPALLGAAADPDLGIPPGATIDTDTGSITGAPGATSTLVAEGSVMIRVFAAPTFTISDVTITGSNPIAFVASGAIKISGKVDASAPQFGDGGPGSQDAGTGCQGAPGALVSCGTDMLCGPGAGGGGNGTVGGNGGKFGGTGPAGGAIANGFEPLVGGCNGGTTTLVQEIDNGYGGGAIQLVSLVEVDVNGILSVGGGGGFNGGGGGAGGLVIIEAPAVSIGATGGILANGGGGGGGCGSVGDDATTAAAAAGGACSDITLDGGLGGTSSAIPLAGGNGMAGDDSMQQYGGGGGSVGRARIATGDGTVQTDPSATMSVVLTKEPLAHD